ncbi:MAG TPA: hypothetical protein VNY73_00235 [Bacteroidia bacterium]|jgi:hypothetical protein|nr:hypothetical protein [Bacteroidia bacterium]
MFSARVDSLFIKVRCVKTVSGLIETSLLVPAHKKLRYKIDYINETYPDTVTPAQAEKMMLIKDTYRGYELLISTARQLQKRSAMQLEQVSRLSAEISKGKDENMHQYLTFESQCTDTLNRVLDELIKRSVDLGCKAQNIN